MRKKVLFMLLVLGMANVPVKASKNSEWTGEMIRAQANAHIQTYIQAQKRAQVRDLDRSRIQGQNQVQIQDQDQILTQNQIRIHNQSQFQVQVRTQIQLQENKSVQQTNQPLNLGQKNDISGDYEFAKFLQNEENQKRASLINEEETSKDERIARFLQQQEGLNYSASSLYNPSQLQALESFSIPEVKVQQALLDHLETVRKASTAFQNGNVHDYNKRIVGPNKSLFQKLQEALELKIDTPIDIVVQDLQKHSSLPLNGCIQKMRAHQLSTADHETGLRVDQLFSAVLSLASKIDDLSYLNSDTYDYVVRSLNENINEQGGCKPGYSGRLFELLSYFSSIYLNNVKILKF